MTCMVIHTYNVYLIWKFYFSVKNYVYSVQFNIEYIYIYIVYLYIFFLEERTICQFHYSAWPDHGVPPLVRPLLDMVRLVRDTQASETLPVLIHCSAGCGRTGTICAIDYVWGLLRAGVSNIIYLFLLLYRY